MFPGLVLVVVFQLVPKPVPYLIALRHRRELSQLIHDGIYLSLDWLFQIAVHFFALGVLEHFGQSKQLVLDGGAITDPGLHLLNQITHCLLRRVAHLLVGLILLLVEVQQLVLKNIVGQLGAHYFDTLLSQIALLWIGGPDHHVDMGMVHLVMEGGAPAELVRRYLHRLRQLRPVSQEELPPALCGVVTQPGSIFPLERVNERPDRS